MALKFSQSPMPLYFRQDFTEDKQRMGEFGEDLGSLLGEGVNKFRTDVGGLGKLGEAWRKYKTSDINPATGKAWNPDNAESPMSFKDWKKSNLGGAAKTKIKDDRALQRDERWRERTSGKGWADEAYTNFLAESKDKPGSPLETGAFRNWLKSDEGQSYKIFYKKG